MIRSVRLQLLSKVGVSKISREGLLRLSFKRSQSNTANQVMKLYGFPLSQPTRSVILLCKEANIVYDFVLVDALKGETRKPDFLKIYPGGMVPIIQEYNIGTLGECSAILQYLAETRSLEKWYPSDPVKKARVNFWLSWNHTNSRLATKKVLVGKLFPPKTGAAEAFAAGVREFTRSVKFVENHLGVTHSKFLESEEAPTLADITVLTEFDQIDDAGFQLFDFTPYPLTKSWMETVKVTLKSYDAVFGPVAALGKEFKARQSQ